MIATCFLSTCLLASASFMVGEVSVRDLWDQSTLIVLGHVERVERIPHEPPSWASTGVKRGGWDGLGAKIAQVRILQTFRGPKDVTSILIPADSAWTCDITNAIPGETAFFFLVSSRVRAMEGTPFRARLDEVFGEHDFLKIAWYGRGRIPVSEGESGGSWKHLGMPPGLRDLSRETGCARGTPYEDFSRLLETYKSLEETPFFTASSTASASGDLAWSLSVANDGSCRLLVHSPEKPVDGFPNPWRGRECILTLDPERLRDLRESISTERAWSLPSILGAARPGPGHREMHFIESGGEGKPHGAGTEIGVHLFAIDDAWMSDASRRDATRRALHIWSMIRGLFEDGACADSRWADRAWLAESR